ncbi:DUF6506 family protein [Egicoccus sp. AB-alg2]|uniref:DUF6506 family protein n=1 Tax=Egicoccus sp. AB-alg2 TaxID=3242693 RepID=UPI00359DD602
MIQWAYVYEHPDTDPVADRHVVERAGLRTLLVPVPDAAMAVQVAGQLVDEGVRLIELCGGFPLPDAARVAAAVGDRVPVGHVTFAVDAIPGAAAFGGAVAERSSV